MEGRNMAIAEQAVILAAGRGTRLQKDDPSVPLDPVTAAIARMGVKALVPINGRAYLDYGIDRLVAAGIRRICLIVAPDSQPLQDYAGMLPSRFPGLNVQCVIQPEPRGTGHALRFAREATGDGDFLMINSDNLYPASALLEAAAAPTGACYAVGFESEALARESNFDASRVSRLGILALRPESPDAIDRVVEKPDNPDAYRSDGRLWVTMNLWRFMPAVYDYCDALPLSPRGEYELPTAVQAMIDDGIPVKMLRAWQGVLDLTSRADIPHLAHILK
jgi:dTDP-glucose pyrophosphorylase